MTPNPLISKRPCIYGIRNVLNNKIYVGQTKCITARCHQYVYDFRERSIGHLNDYLFSAMSKHGLQNFEMFPIEFCPTTRLAEKEWYWISHYGSLDRNRGYNLRSDVDRKMHVSPETSEKISSNLKKQWAGGVRDKHSDKLKAAWAGRDDWRETAANTLRASITKWAYRIIFADGSVKDGLYYSDLKDLGVHNVISSFHRKGSNEVKFKNMQISRRPKGE